MVEVPEVHQTLVAVEMVMPEPLVSAEGVERTETYAR